MLNKKKLLEMLSVPNVAAKLGFSLMNQLHKLASNQKIRLLLQKLRVLGLANWTFSKFSSSIAWLLKTKGPIYFLGEKLLTEKEWLNRLSSGEGGFEIECPKSAISDWSTPIAAILVSLYKSDSFLHLFLRNIEEQTIIEKCEVVIVSVSPSGFEKKTLEAFANNKEYVNLIFSDDRIGIYEAWNRAISSSSAPYITNMNADDIRHPLSLEIQVSELEQRGGVDVVYQDVYYTLRQNLTFDEIAKVGMRSTLPEASTQILARGINVPHNAPMWRRDLHDRVGLFDETFLSAGDHDFWIRASIKGANFKKSEQVHVSYFINPDGMSTKKNSPGSSEGLKILDTYRHYAEGVTK